MSCKKETPTLNDKVEGSWQVAYYQVSVAVYPEYIKNGLSFRNEGINKGTILWAEHRELDGTKDTVTGSYTLDANASTMQIQWHNVASPHGMTKGTSYSVNFLQDSLNLTRLVEGFDYEVIVKAVHN